MSITFWDLERVQSDKKFKHYHTLEHGSMKKSSKEEKMERQDENKGSLVEVRLQNLCQVYSPEGEYLGVKCYACGAFPLVTNGEDWIGNPYCSNCGAIQFFYNTYPC